MRAMINEAQRLIWMHYQVFSKEVVKLDPLQYIIVSILTQLGSTYKLSPEYSAMKLQVYEQI